MDEFGKASIEVELLQGQISFQMGCGVWGFEIRRRMEIRNKLSQKVSLNEIT